MRRIVACVLALLFAVATIAVADAQTRGGGKRKSPAKRAAPRDAGPSAAATDAGAAPIPARESNLAGTAAAPAAPFADAGAVEARTADGGVKVFRFGEVEIEGRLRNPQLVYFLRRVRAEFAAGDLGHRSFMPELSQTRNDPNF